MDWVTAWDQWGDWHGIGAIVGGIVLLWLVLRVVAWIGARPRKGRPCRWQRAKRHDKTTLRCWTCRTCGVQAYSATRRAPVDCKEALRTRPL